MLRAPTDGKPENATAYPRLSIITPSLNAADYICATIESVLVQGYSDFEHIVVDGGSTDGTLRILAGYQHLRVVTGPDEGLYDAVNKGLRFATGKIIGVLNADDLYPDGLLAEVGRTFAAEPDVDVVTGGSVVFEEDGRDGRRVVVARNHLKQDGFWLPELAFGVPAINGCFFRRRAFARIGDFNNDYFIAADRHFLIRAALAGIRARCLYRVTIYNRVHAGSRTFNPQRRFSHEITREHIRMAREFVLATRGDSPRYRVFAAWHAFESAKLVLRSLKAGRPGESLRAFLALALLNPLWPMRFLHGLSYRDAVRGTELHGAAANDALR